MWRSSRFLKTLLFGILCIGCVEKSDPYPDPSQGGDGEPGAGTALVSISYLKGYYTGYATPITKDWELQGVVTANDRYGTFPYGLVVQDATGGIEIKLSGDDLFLTYPIGQPIRIRCQGLVVGAYGGYVTLGSVSSDADYQDLFRKLIFRDDCQKEVKSSLYCPIHFVLQNLNPNMSAVLSLLRWCSLWTKSWG